ncbi:hypothetical protein C8R43DRAFT_901391 [Mycena crocata]|nr:hypothetical protein C8R43DRAFT_901391 [Mycena crocata]
MLDACSRMYEMPCKWLSCGCVLNSFDTLITHLHEVHGKENDELETCMWDLCGDSFLNRTTLILHSETHVLDAIPCGYQDCDEVFHTPGQLVVHNHKHAEANRPLKPSAVPSALREPMPQPELPETPIPGWAVFIPPVQMPNISRDRHNTLGPWILRNICAPSAARARPYNAAMPLKFQPDYEFVETSSINYSCVPSRPARVRDMADLNSKEVSNQVAEGKLVFWPAPEPTEHKIEKLDAGKGPEEEEMAVESMLQDNIEGKEAIQNVA